MLKCFRVPVLVVTVFFVSAIAFGQAYQTISVTNGGTVTGTVKWSGPMPQTLSMAITKDPQICDPASAKTRDLERLIVGPQGGVANAVVFLKKNTSRGKPMDIPEQRRFLDQKHCRYEPHILLVPVSAPLQMKSSDATLHSIHMDGAATYNLPFPFPNQVVSRDMPNAGLVNLRCNGGHTWMNGTIFVAQHPYYAVTYDSGKFELSDVPPGEYEIVAWHEGWGLARREGTFDVLTQRRVERPVFTEPRTWETKVAVAAKGNAAVTFVIAAK